MVTNFGWRIKTLFLEKRGKHWNFLKRFFCIWVFYKFVLNSVKSLNRVLLAAEYWLKALKCHIWMANTRPFYWESKPNIESLQDFFHILELDINLFSNLSKAWMESLELRNFSSRLWNAKFLWRIQNRFSAKTRQFLKLSKTFLLIFEFPINFFWSVSRA